MKRIIVTAVFIVVFFLMQTTVFQHLAFASISPNFMIILASSYGFMRGKKEGMIVGFVSGLFMDVFYGVGSMIGAYALIYLLIGYCNGFFNRMFFEDDIKLPILLISASELVFGICNYIFLYMMRSKFDFWYYFWNIIVPELVYTIIITLFLYQLILYVNQRLDDDEKRGAGKLV